MKKRSLPERSRKSWKYQVSLRFLLKLIQIIEEIVDESVAGRNQTRSDLKRKLTKPVREVGKDFHSDDSSLNMDKYLDEQEKRAEPTEVHPPNFI